MANTLTFNQLSTVLTSVVQQATGQTPLTPTNTSEFVAVAQTALLTGYDPVINAVSQVLSRTIFSIRPYNRKFKGLMVDNIKYGNHVRKLQSVDKPWENDDRLPLTDGKSVDQQVVNKPAVLQTNFYGAEMYQKSLTIFRDQLDSAFSNEAEFGRFISMIMQNASDMIEQAHETTNRATVANLIGGIIIAGSTQQVIHLVTEYNAAAGTTLTSETVMQPDNFVPFIKWAFARIATLSDLLTERSVMYHTNITGKPVARHTPKRMQRLYLSSSFVNQMDAVVLSTVFHDNRLEFGDYERVNFWQSIQNPTTLNITPTYLKTDGTLVTPEAAIEEANVFGVIMDEEAAGVTVVNEWSAAAPFNARGGYTNIFWHFTDRYWNDFTENAIVLLLD